MMSSSVRYAWARWGVALQSATRDCVAGRLRLTDAVARAVEEATSEKNKLTTVVRHVGSAMAPTLGGNPRASELLLVRSLAASPATVFRGDVVLLAAPTPGAPLLVRRVAALEGDEMESSTEGDVPFRVPEGRAWVTADNEAEPSAVDSRAFGDLPLGAIKGRVVYAVRADEDHGAVANSVFATQSDAPIIKHELDVAAMLRHAKKGG